MSVSIGIVGLPNVGKSTLFNALTNNSVLASNYPFATIEPNTGIVAVPDKRLVDLTRTSNSKKSVPAIVSFTDIAGIVRGAADGAGLGNKFLSHIRGCSAIVQVVRAFDDDNIVHVDDSVDPKRDIETITTELCLADVESLQKRRANLEKEAKSSSSTRQSLNEIDAMLDHLNQGQLLSHSQIEQGEFVSDLQLLTYKPFIYVFNVDEHTLNDSELKQKLTSLVDKSPVVFLSAQTEYELSSLDEADKVDLLHSLGQEESGLALLARAGYSALNLQSYYTSGEMESRAWTIKKGSLAPQAAGVIHTDFEKGFIKADVVSYDDFIDHHGWNGARTAGKVRLEGKDYVMHEDDVVEFKFNV